ncbi:MAG: BrnA antitoxin family protein [Terriglobales bacterium]|jgi:uncharacterized protein (DUF4415 family)
MKRPKRVARRGKATRKSTKVTRKLTKIEASEGRKRPRYLPEELAGMYKPLKKPVTLRLDADILAYFQRGGRGYQTRINRALRKVMMEERGPRSR